MAVFWKKDLRDDRSSCLRCTTGVERHWTCRETHDAPRNKAASRRDPFIGTNLTCFVTYLLLLSLKIWDDMHLIMWSIHHGQSILAWCAACVDWLTSFLHQRLSTNLSMTRHGTECSWPGCAHRYALTGCTVSRAPVGSCQKWSPLFPIVFERFSLR
jgi:hypothetical protein